MRYNEIKPLEEVNMSPSALQTAASQIQALVGTEFELCVPGVQTSEELDYDSGMRPDFSEDRPAYSIDDIVDFFTGSEYGLSVRAANKLRGNLEEDFLEQFSIAQDKAWEKQGKQFFIDYMQNRGWSGSLDELKDIWDDHTSSDIEEALEAFYDEFTSYTETDWLDGTTMIDISDRYDAEWPYYSETDNDDSRLEYQLEELAGVFSEALGRKVEYSTSYHGRLRRPDRYTLEPDGSIETGDSSVGGCEFISPPLPVNEMLSDLGKVVDWADSYGCYTNASTGLHMNVSIPGYSLEKLDYVKLVLFLGDEYVLSQFGRLSNVFAKSAFQNIQRKAKSLDFFGGNNEVSNVLGKIRNGLNLEASRILHGVMTEKYTSVNIKEKYIEFRSPGGDWLNEDLDKLKNTMLRFIVVLDIACDANKYREEYAKKLYTLLSKSSGAPSELNVVELFAQYSAGTLPKSELLSKIKGYRKQMDQFQQMVSAADNDSNKIASKTEKTI